MNFRCLAPRIRNMHQLIIILLTILSLFPSLHTCAFGAQSAQNDRPRLYADMAQGAGAYDRAVAEALRNSGLEGKREELLKRFMALTDIVDDRNEELSEMFTKYRDEYYGSNASAKLEKRIDHESGLYANGPCAGVITRINRNALSELKPPGTASVSITGTPAEFEERLSAIEASLQVERSDLATALRNATRYYPVFCGPEHLEPYHLKYDCPSRVTGARGEMPVARAIIVSKDI